MRSILFMDLRGVSLKVHSVLGFMPVLTVYANITLKIRKY